MRFAIVAVAGLIAWLWFATREPDAPAAPTTPRSRRADLSALHAQVAAAGAPREKGDMRADTPAFELAADTTDAEMSADDLQRGADLSELVAQIEEAAADTDGEDNGELVIDVSPVGTRIFVDGVEVNETIGHEVIQIMGSAPIIDTSPARGCYTIDLEYTKNIPVGRTFEGVLGAAADGQGQEYSALLGVSFSSGTTLENTYIVEDNPSQEVPEDDIIIED